MLTNACIGGGLLIFPALYNYAGGLINALLIQVVGFISRYQMKAVPQINTVEIYGLCIQLWISFCFSSRWYIYILEPDTCGLFY